MGQKFWEVRQGFDVHFQRCGGWTWRAVSRPVEAWEGHKCPYHGPRVLSALKIRHHLCLISPRRQNLFCGQIDILLRDNIADKYLPRNGRRHRAVVNGGMGCLARLGDGPEGCSG